MRLKATMKSILILCLLITCTSCASVGARSKGESYGNFYPATKIDAKLFVAGTRGASDWVFIPRWLLYTIGIIDLPFSIVTDTLFLPVDIIVMTKNTEIKESVKHNKALLSPQKARLGPP
jgi:uncharacterized protein YceK